ncbi:hypothetical protein F511_21871 [Dorcoceras hygrometricum]|uniref:Zinc finger, CCHC-type n=1 Tax=Dorcoceras hygrometricum TaxID=472368 RepID=A0A2Z7AGB3_9LAMI|nr:hypothetical protein F511_21871 [Dorcoceras hygrometricum]
MQDSKPIISQVQELQLILHDIHAEGMTLSESFQVAAIIEKLPPSWKDFKNYLKHKRKEMNVEELIVDFELKKTIGTLKGVYLILMLPKKMLLNMATNIMRKRSRGHPRKTLNWEQGKALSRRNSWGSATIVMEWVTRLRIVRNRREPERLTPWMTSLMMSQI